MAAAGLEGWTPRKRRHFGRPTTRPVDVRNPLVRDFTALELERKWVTDIAEIAAQEGKLFLCVERDSEPPKPPLRSRL